MAIEGGCYCGALRYRIAAPMPRGGLCYCRACQHASGGAPNAFVLVQQSDFTDTEGKPAAFSHPEKPNAVTREFCAQCGTQVSTVRPDMAGKRVVKIGTFDAPQEWPGPGFAIFTAQKAPWHVIPPDLPAFPELPPR